MSKIEYKDGGFSLVEIIMAIAIISIVAGTVGYGISFVSGKPAEECAKKLASTLSHARTSTMGKYRNIVTIEYTNSGIKVTEHVTTSLDESGTTEEEYNERVSYVGSKSVNVEYSTDGTNWLNLNGNTLEVRFNSGSGALSQPLVTGGKLIFRISKANTTREVTVTELTGNITTS